MQNRDFSRIALRHLLFVGLFAGTLVRCDCEDITFRAAAKYTPDSVLDFGAVSVTSEKTLDIVVLNEGSAGLRILEPTVSMSPDKWRVVTREDLLTGITPGKTSSITVTYRPCPDAWETKNVGGVNVDVLKENFDFNTCMPPAVESADLNIVEVDTTDGTQRITLSARPVQPPNASVYCQNGVMDCNATNPDVDPCNAMTFGPVTGGDEPCGMVVELRNNYRDGKAVGDLEIQGIQIDVQNIDQEVTVGGAEAGFTVHNLDESPLEPNPGDPFVVPIAQGEEEGRERFLIKFSGIASGTWDGRAARSMTGVKIYTNDPDKPVLTFAINGTGSACDIDWQPRHLNFGPVALNTTKTLTATITNSGDAICRITSIGFENDQTMQTFEYSTSRGESFPIELQPAERMQVYISYTPRQSGTDADALVIINNDIKEMNRVEIAMTGGAVPVLRVDPPDVLPFPIGMTRMQEILLSNVGYGDLTIQKMEITGPQGEPTHPSADDFKFADGCENPCLRQVTLCPVSIPGCTSSQTAVQILYQNNDISSIDFAELHIFSTDPAAPEHIVVLNADDEPCLPGIAQVMYTPTQPCKNMPVTLDGTASSPGGPNGNGATLIRWEWEWLFTPTGAPAFVPPEGAMVQFTPTDSGLYVVGLKVTNDCGAVSALATETVMVAETCN